MLFFVVKRDLFEIKLFKGSLWLNSPYTRSVRIIRSKLRVIERNVIANKSRYKKTTKTIRKNGVSPKTFTDI